MSEEGNFFGGLALGSFVSLLVVALIITKCSDSVQKDKVCIEAEAKDYKLKQCEIPANNQK